MTYSFYKESAARQLRPLGTRATPPPGATVSVGVNWPYRYVRGQPAQYSAARQLSPVQLLLSDSRKLYWSIIIRPQFPCLDPIAAHDDEYKAWLLEF